MHSPLRPEPPPDGACCGSGCALCVFDRYEQELAAWMAAQGGGEQECAGKAPALAPGTLDN